MDHADFLRSFLRHEADLRAFIGAFVRDRQAREDVLQEVALALWEQSDRYDPARPFGAWARGIAANKILQRWRQDGRRPAPFPPEAVDAVMAAFERGDPEVEVRSEALRECVNKLPADARRLISLRFEDGLRGQEIARRIWSNITAVYKTFSRMMESLENCIRRRLASRNIGSEP